MNNEQQIAIDSLETRILELEEEVAELKSSKDVIIDKSMYMEVYNLRKQLDEANARLEKIVKWEMPYPYYYVYWGSNGERDYIISVAKGEPVWFPEPNKKFTLSMTEEEPYVD